MTHYNTSDRLELPNLLAGVDYYVVDRSNGAMKHFNYVCLNDKAEQEVIKAMQDIEDNRWKR